jgi:hypothetical protein
LSDRSGHLGFIIINAWLWAILLLTLLCIFQFGFFFLLKDSQAFLLGFFFTDQFATNG